MKKTEKISERNPRTYTVDEIAAMLGISRSSAHKLLKQDDFSVAHIGNSIRVSKKSFDARLDALELCISPALQQRRIFYTLPYLSCIKKG